MQFQSSSKECSPFQEYSVHQLAATFLSCHLGSFTEPLHIIEDLTSFGIKDTTISPSIVRKMLRYKRCILFFSRRPKEALISLDYYLIAFSEITYCYFFATSS